jgi:hypothetical protein
MKNRFFTIALFLLICSQVMGQREDNITQAQDIFYYFEITDNPSSEAIPIDPEIPEGLNYRIQIGTFRNPVAPVFFRGITPVYGITNASNSELKTYYAGMFRRLSDANAALAEVKNRGFDDALVAFFLYDMAVSINRAATLEQEWGTIPFETIINNNPATTADILPAPPVVADNPPPVTTTTTVAVDNSGDELLPTLVFRVEVMRVARAITPAALETLRTLAGNRGLDVITTANRQTAYIIGNFITYNSAAEYADLLVRNGYRDTKVIAWLGNREIPLEIARQLFDSL